MKNNILFCSVLSSFFIINIVSSCTKVPPIEPEETACTSEFNAEMILCTETRKAVYRFTSATDEPNVQIQGELTHVKGPDPVVTVTGATMNVIHSADAGNYSRFISLEGAVTACEEVTITITWSTTAYDNIVSSNWTVKNQEGTELAPAIAPLECDPRKPGN